MLTLVDDSYTPEPSDDGMDFVVIELKLGVPKGQRVDQIDADNLMKLVQAMGFQTANDTAGFNLSNDPPYVHQATARVETT